MNKLRLQKIATYLIIAISVAALLSGIFIFHELNTIDSRLRDVASQHSKWVSKNTSEFEYLFSDIFPFAKKCAERGSTPTTYKSYIDNCDSEVRSRIDSRFNTLLDVFHELGCYRYDDGVCRKHTRLPIYFIRLQDDNHIEKLFQDGVYFVETVDTKAEKSVVKILKGEQSPLPYPLWTCCGGDDFLELVPFLPTRVYLKDLYTEIEFIFPIKNTKESIIGAVVWLYGD